MSDPYRLVGRRNDGTPKPGVSPEFIATLVYQGVPVRVTQALAANVGTIQVFNAVQSGAIDSEMGAIILLLKNRGQMTWFGRVWEAIRWWP